MFGAICALLLWVVILSPLVSATPSVAEDFVKGSGVMFDWSDFQNQAEEKIVTDAEAETIYGVANVGIETADGTKEIVPTDAGPTGFPELALPTCKCASYKSGATPSDTTLCASPWGEPSGHGQQCSQTNAKGACPLTMHKCTTAPSPAPEENSPCLCAFDIDRTLTAMQAYAASPKGVVHGARRSNCPNTTVVPGTYDWAFGGGQLTLSALSTVGVAQTACAECYVGITSRGWAQGTMAKNH